MKFGYCCKHSNIKLTKNGFVCEAVEDLNFKSTTSAWMKRQSLNDQHAKIHSLVDHNVKALRLVLAEIATMPPELRMFRIGSDILPLYTHPDHKGIYQNLDLMNHIQSELEYCGEFARTHGIRLSFHPGQYTILGSDRDDVVLRSIEDLEYHGMIASMMGYGQSFQDFKINIHLSGRGGVERFRDSFNKLSSHVKSMLTVENEEFGGGGIEECLKLGDTIPIVFDNHHHWVRTGEHMSPDDDRIKRVLDSWRGVRPAMHYSQPRLDVLEGVQDDQNTFPNMNTILTAGLTRSAMRAHSDYYWNQAMNTWIAEYAKDFDIQCECKWKNYGSSRLAEIIQDSLR